MLCQSRAGKMPCGRGSVCSEERGVRKRENLPRHTLWTSAPFDCVLYLTVPALKINKDYHLKLC